MLTDVPNSHTVTVLNTHTYSALKPYQQEFIRMIANWWHGTPATAGLTPPTTFDRSLLRSIALNNGMKWAPAWVVKDKSRQKSRGLYMVPEVPDYILSVMPTEKKTSDATANAAEAEPAAV